MSPRAGSGGLDVRDVSVTYGSTVAVDHVSVAARVGEVVALLGPSGCGKSSLLRAVGGLEPVAAGSVEWNGVDLAGVPVHRRGFGLMFQEGQLFPHRDVAGNVGFGLQMAHVGPADRARRVDELLELVGLAGYGRRAIATLSGGEQQRVSLARSLAPSPQLLLLDEPLSALDRSLRERLASDLRAALLATGTTALFVTHDHDEAFVVADRVAVMAAGRLLQVAAPADLWRAPGSRQVAEFLGYEAFVSLDAAPPLLASALRGALGPRSADAPREGGVAALAEGAFVVVPAARLPGGSMPDGAVPGRVRTVAFRRGRTELAVAVDGAGTLTALAPGAGSWRPGDLVDLVVDAQRVAALPAS